jgi:two-component system cell cycle sensor histidine kinase PleC
VHAAALSKIALADAREWTAGRLAANFPALPATTTCGEIYDWLGNAPSQPAIALLDDRDRVVGLVNRLLFLSRYAQRYYPELYSKRSVLALASTAPLVVDASENIADVAATLVLEKPDALVECFVVTENGRYLGLGTGEALMRCKVALLQAHQTDLSQALDAAMEASRAKSSFLALMSHELRTPLNAIIGFSEVLNGEMLGSLGNDKYREYAGDIHGAGRHLLALINDILDLSKAEAGKLELRAETVDLSELMRECRKLVWDRGVNRQLEFSILEPAVLPCMLADRLRIKQVLLNLLSNAMKFTPAGGSIWLEAGVENDGGLRVAVRDTGIGMAEDMIPVALEPFRQISSPLARNVEGTGLGLSLVKSLVEAHGGTLAIASTLHRGTTVTLRFPPERTLVERAVLSA